MEGKRQATKGAYSSEPHSTCKFTVYIDTMQVSWTYVWPPLCPTDSARSRSTKLCDISLQNDGGALLCLASSHVTVISE